MALDSRDTYARSGHSNWGAVMPSGGLIPFVLPQQLIQASVETMTRGRRQVRDRDRRSVAADRVGVPISMGRIVVRGGLRVVRLFTV